MREIMFRGKSTNGIGWIEGSLRITTIQPADDAPYKQYEIEDTTLGLFPNDFMCGICETVDPETVGQFTGLTDKNGKRIFEGDIVRYTFDSPDDPMATKNGLKVHTGRIFWSDWRASFAVTAGRNGSAALNNDVSRYVRGRQVFEYVRGSNTVEVIGNIHDNPDLLIR